MAYPEIEAPYGLLPINLIGGQPFAGSTRMIPVASGYGTAIFYGDVVKLAANGTLEKDTGTTTATPVGVFLGCSYTDPVFGKTFRQYLPAGTAASDIEAFVLDNPNALFKVAIVSGTTVIDGVTRAVVGSNSSLVQNAGIAATGKSQVAISSSVATTSTLPVRVIDLIAETRNVDGEYTEAVVKWNAGKHQYENATGV